MSTEPHNSQQAAMRRYESVQQDRRAGNEAEALEIRTKVVSVGYLLIIHESNDIWGHTRNFCILVRRGRRAGRDVGR